MEGDSQVVDLYCDDLGGVNWRGIDWDGFESYGAELMLTLKGPMAEEMVPLILADGKVLGAVGVVVLTAGHGNLARPS